MQGGKKFSLSLDEPKEDLTDVEVKAVMDSIVDKTYSTPPPGT